MSDLLCTATEAMKIINALNAIDMEPTMIVCKACNGKQYTHFAGEPDWCNRCGGMGMEQDEDADLNRKINAIQTKGA